MSFPAFSGDAEIVRVNPAAVLRVWFADGIETECRTDPLALAGIESIFHVRPLLAVKRIRKSAHGNWSQRTLWCVARHHRNPKPYILDPCWLKTRFDYRRRNSGKDLGLLLGIRLRIAANRVHYFEGITFQPKAQPCMIKSLNDQPAFLTILLRAISARVSSPRTEAATNCPAPRRDGPTSRNVRAPSRCTSRTALPGACQNTQPQAVRADLAQESECVIRGNANNIGYSRLTPSSGRRLEKNAITSRSS